MTFVSAAFLAAAAAGIIPVVLHMINRQQAKNLPFSTLRFLRISAEKTRRRKRIHDLLLMLLRVAVLLLIAIGLAEPTLTGLDSFWGSGTSAVAIILDNSASMGIVDDGRPRFETARGAAREIMGELVDGDQVVLMLTGGPELAEQGRLHRSHEKILQTLDQAHVSYERADLAEKLRDARELLDKADCENKQIFVLTDMQELSWAGLEEAAAEEPDDAEEEEPGERISVILVDCNQNPKPNVAVSGVEVTAAVPVAGLPVNATVELFNSSTLPQQRHLELYIDGAKEATSPELEISPEGRLTHDFQFAFKRGGLHRGEVRLVGEDGSRYDDQRYFSMEVDRGIPVAVVKPERHEIPYLEDTFYLEQALAPARTGNWALRTTTLTADELLSEPLSNYKALFCVNLPAPDADTAQRLRTYVARGGNLFWLAGDNVDPAVYNAMNETAGGQLLPAPLVDVRLPPQGGDRDAWHIATLNEENSAMAQLTEPASLYRSVLVYKHLRMDTQAAPEAVVLARLDDGEALLVQAKVEQGTASMLGISAHIGWSNFPVRPIFLPMMARLTFEAAGVEQSKLSMFAGAPLELPLPEEMQAVTVEVRPPSGEMIRLDSEPLDGRVGQEFSYVDTHGVGIYTLQLLDSSQPTTLAYSVNLDPAEADGKPLDREEAEERFGKTPLLFADDPADLSSTFLKLREGESLWELVLAAVLAALVFETLISNLLNPQRDERQSPTDHYGSLPVRSAPGYSRRASSKSAPTH